MDLSVVTTLYQSAPFLTEFYRRISAQAQLITDTYEIVFVNDGSPDDSLVVALGLQAKDGHVRIVDLSRNFGHHAAIMAGLAHARGALVFLIDCDLEEEPETLAPCYDLLRAQEADVVYGVQDVRKGSVFERFSGWLFYSLFNVLSDTPIPRNLTTVRLMTGRYVARLLDYQERELCISGLWELTGFKQVPLVIRKCARPESTYTLGRKLELVFNAVTSFSVRPLIYVFYVGFFIFTVASLAALVLIVRQLWVQEFLAGWASLIVSIWMIGGLIIFCQGIIGIYLAKVFLESKQRPRVVLRALYERHEEEDAELRGDPARR